VQGHFIEVHIGRFSLSVSDRAKPKPHKARIKADARVVVQPGTGINVPIRVCRKTMAPEAAECFYLLEPTRNHHDLVIGRMAGAPRAIIRHDERSLPYTNFGKAPVLIRPGELLAHA
jgi:hypothetical protein